MKAVINNFSLHISFGNNLLISATQKTFPSFYLFYFQGCSAVDYDDTIIYLSSAKAKAKRYFAGKTLKSPHVHFGEQC